MDLHERLAQLSPQKRALLLGKLREKTGDGARSRPPIERRQRDSELLPLSSAQQRLWFLEQLEPGTAAYNVATAVRISGNLNPMALKDSLREIHRRHETMRTHVATFEGQPAQVIRDQVSLDLQEVDLCHLPEETREAESARWVDQAARRPFDLETGPLVRTALLKLSETEHVLVVVMHHIVSDGWSFGVLFGELARAYEALAQGASPLLPELPVQYADYVHWQRECLQGEAVSTQLVYWKQQLRGAPEALDLPTDRPRTVSQTFEGRTQVRRLSKQLSEALRALSQREETTLFMTLLAAFQTLLMRYSSAEDVIVGSPVAGRARPELESLIGCFVNTLALRTDLSGNPTFRELSRRVRRVCLDAYSHQELPFERLVEELQPARVRSRPPLFQVMFVLQNLPTADAKLPGLDLTPFPINHGTAKFDLTLAATEHRGQLAFELERNTHLFDSATTERMLDHFETLLGKIVADPDCRIWDLPLLNEPERRQLLVEWNSTATDYPRGQCIQELFEERVERAPDAVAVVYEEESWTYRELNERSNRLAWHLKSQGVGPDVLVGIAIERSFEMVVGLLGILKAGGAYVPLDPEYPKERLGFMAADAGMQVLLTMESVLERLPEHHARVICLDRDWPEISPESTDNPACEISPENLAYVIYTSGSTGLPKGTLIPHRAVVRLIRETNYVRLGPTETMLQFSTISFDASTFEIWGSLLNGARLVLFPGRRASLEMLGDVIQREGVTTLWLTAGLFHEMIERHPEGLRGVRQLLAGGDVLSVRHVKKAAEMLPECRLINGYGPTENTTFTCCYPMTDVGQLGTSVSIGRPVSNTQVYVLDPHLRPVPIGVVGELYIGGDGLARGYLKRPDLTAERFIRNPFHGGSSERLYRSGDKVRYLPEGRLEFLGRDDDQVKLRGYRVELGEIEMVLSAHAGVRDALVLAREDEAGDKRLVAYCVAGSGHVLSASELRSYLKDRLPGYMVPSTFMTLEAFPLTANGKVDRQALPVPDRGRADIPGALARPRCDLERQLVGIWEDALAKSGIGVEDDFFELGGHSLLAVRMFAQIEKRLGRRLPVDILFEAPTIRQLASELRRGEESIEASSLVAIQPSGSRIPFFAVPPSASPSLVFASLAKALGKDQPFYGLTPQPLGGSELPRDYFQETASCYLREVRRIQSNGPYLLGGRCFGGFVAYEMAQQLASQGEEVGLLALMDVGHPLTHDIRFYLRRAEVDARMFYRNLRRSFRNLPPIEYAMIPFHPIHFDVVPEHRRAKADQDKLVWDANLRAAANYVTRPYGGRITLLQSSSHDDPNSREKWSKLAAGGLDYDVVPGPHKEVLQEPLVQIMAEKLTRRLRSAVRTR